MSNEENRPAFDENGTLTDFQSYLQLPPYGAAREEKARELTEVLRGLTKHHQENCQNNTEEYTQPSHR